MINHMRCCLGHPASITRSTYAEALADRWAESPGPARKRESHDLLGVPGIRARVAFPDTRDSRWGRLVGPFGLTGSPNCALNWLALIDLGSPESVSDAASLADTLVVRGNGTDNTAEFSRVIGLKIENWI